MKLIKAEFKKTITEAISYYPDYIVGLITDILLLLVIMNTNGDKSEKVIGYILWILVSGVLSEASICISTEKQLGTLQNLMIKPCSIASIVCAKTLIWFIINFAKAMITAAVASFFLNIDHLFQIEYFYVIIMVCIGVMGLSFILTALTLIFTKVASFVSVIGYLFLFLSGSIVPIPYFLTYTNPLSCGVNYITLIMNHQVTISDFTVLLLICFGWLLIGYAVFQFVFHHSKQFKWTY